MKKRFHLVRWYLKRHPAEELFEKVQLGLTVLMQLSFIGAAIIALFEKTWIVLFVSVAAMVAIWLPLFFARSRRVYIPIEFEFILTAFIYGTIFLGEIHGFYTKFWWWDMVLHAGSGVALGFIGFLVLYSLYRNGRLVMKPSLLAMFSFTFALALGAIWEIFEFTMDTLFGFNMQRTGLPDTMRDLIVDALGALATAISGYLYVRFHKRGVGIFQYYITAYFKKNEESNKATIPPQR